MNREQALQSMLSGNKVTHKYFTDEEYIYINPDNGRMLTEDGYGFSVRFNSDPMFDDGWSVYQSN